MPPPTDVARTTNMPAPTNAPRPPVARPPLSTDSTVIHPTHT